MSANQKVDQAQYKKENASTKFFTRIPTLNFLPTHVNLKGVKVNKNTKVFISF